MLGLLSQYPKNYVQSVDTFENSFTSINGGGFGASGNIGLASSPSLIGENRPTQQFDISVLSNLRPSDKYLGRNRVSDIRETYETYLSGNPIGKGGQYAVDAARRYGTTITEAARGYLVNAGLPTLAEIISPIREQTTTPIRELTPVDDRNFPLPTNQTTTTDKNPFELLIDAFTRSFGNAVYNPPLQSQSSGFTGASTDVPLSESTGGSNIGTFIIIGVVGVIAYFLYKRFA